MKKHEIKILPEYFEHVLYGDKTFEIRKNDRDYKVGDIVLLREYEPEIRKYTRREITVEITYIFIGDSSANEVIMNTGWCVFGFKYAL